MGLEQQREGVMRIESSVTAVSWITLRAVTPAKVAVVPANQLDRAELMRVAAGHRREEAARR